MSRLSLSDMGIDLTTELAELFQLSVSDQFFLGKEFIRKFSEALIVSNVKSIRELLAYYRVNLCRHRTKAISIFDRFNKKLRNVNSVELLIQYMKQEDRWGDVVIYNLQGLKNKGIDFINLDYHPYRYAEAGMPSVECWLSNEIKKNDCPFEKGTAIEFFFDLVECVRNYEDRFKYPVVYPEYDDKNGCFNIRMDDGNEDPFALASDVNDQLSIMINAFDKDNAQEIIFAAAGE